MAKKKKKSGAGGKIFSVLLLVISIGVFCTAGYKLYTIFHEYDKGDDSYDELEAYIDDEKAPGADDDKDPFHVDFDKLLKKNGDLIGWIRIDDPVNISYPLMQSKDNKFYLRRLFTKEHNILGSIFMDYNCSSRLSDDNTIIYGHNTKNGSMFGGLKKWKEKKEFKKNPYFYLYTPDGLSYQYQICSITVTDARSSDYKLDFEDDEEFLAWEAEIQKNSLYDTGVSLNEHSRIVTLSTCTNRIEDERLVVHGVQVKVRECEK